MYARKYVHLKLLHRCQHVVASDVNRTKGQLANVCLTRSKISEHKDLHHGSSYETYLAHCVRGELKLLDGHFIWHQAPSSSGSTTALSPPWMAIRRRGKKMRRSTDADPTSGSSADASDFGPLRDKVTLQESWDKADMRKNVAEKRENIQALMKRRLP